MIKLLYYYYYIINADDNTYQPLKHTWKEKP